MQKKIFIIDDDSDDRDLFREALRETDESVFCQFATDGTSALQTLRKPGTLVPDYIFLDLNMPLMSGKECLIQLKKLPALKDIPIIIFTTSALSEDEEETQRLGATLFFTKPDVYGE